MSSPWHSVSFNPRAPRGARPTLWTASLDSVCFNPRAPRGARRRVNRQMQCNVDLFQSTRPARGATLQLSRMVSAVSCFNPRAPRGARRSIRCRIGIARLVSIHAPRAGRDAQHCVTADCIVQVSIHAPRAGRDVMVSAGLRQRSAWFQSTRPARGATDDAVVIAVSSDVSIHAPRTGRDGVRLHSARNDGVSIHAPRTGRDGNEPYHLHSAMFQSTRPVRGATTGVSATSAPPRCFNPRAPYGARLPVTA